MNFIKRTYLSDKDICKILATIFAQRSENYKYGPSLAINNVSMSCLQWSHHSNLRHMDGLVQKKRNSIANALELLLFCFNSLHAICSEGTKTYIYILCHCSTLIWQR